ncbi:hypothetical protein RsTz2092_07550 [Deferribacterales bacterium RsTz2092]|nr:hypothetical protein AGMMS49941_01500 [Deferribacterales bacterium]
MTILIVKLGMLGDIVMASTMLAPLRARYAEAHISWLCYEWAAELVEQFAGIDEVIPIRGDMLFGGGQDRLLAESDAQRALAGRHFDLVYITYANDRYLALVKTAECGRVVRYRGAIGPLSERYEGVEYARFALENESAVLEPPQFARLRATINAVRGDMVLLAPMIGAYNRSRLRCWELKNYRTLAEKLLIKGVPVGLLGSVSETSAESAFSGLAVQSYIGKTSLRGLLELLASARALVCGDTGTMHMSFLVDTPTVALFGPTSAVRRVPPARLKCAISVGATEGLYCTPCNSDSIAGGYPNCPSNECMKRISVERVMERLNTEQHYFV